jgi:hypothetical protein
VLAGDGLAAVELGEAVFHVFDLRFGELGLGGKLLFEMNGKRLSDEFVFCATEAIGCLLKFGVQFVRDLDGSHEGLAA